METKNPLVSICIPVYNGEAMIERALKSAVSQSYKNLEIIVVDNASTDKTPDIIKRFADSDKRIRSERNSENLGFTGNLLKAFSLARGEYVQLLCHDDWLSANYVEVGARHLNENQEAASVFTTLVDLDQRGDKPAFSIGVDFRPGIYSKDFFLRNMYKSQWGSICIISMFRGEHVPEAVKLINKIIDEHRDKEDFKHYWVGVMVDWLFYLAIVKNYKEIIFTDEAAYVKAEHSNNEGLRHGWDFNKASGLLAYYGFHKKALDYIYPIEFKKYSLGMDIFNGSEAIASIIFDFIKKRFSFAYLGGLNFQSIKKFFLIFSLGEGLLIVIDVPFRLMLRALHFVLKKIEPKKEFKPNPGWRLFD